MNKVICILLVNLSVFANALTTINVLNKTSKLKLVSNLKHITQADLKLATTVENVHNLLSLAYKEKRISFQDQYKYRSTFNNFKDGDLFLLKCLKSKNCEINKFSKVIDKSSLHRQLIRKNPTKSLPYINQKVGLINENIMNKYFTSTGWTKIEGEVGRNGIDGLFIKRNKNGIIKDVMIVESKYNKSGLQHTNNGQQMTKQWIQKKIDDLKKSDDPKIKQYNSDYIQIERLVENDVYKSRLWNLKVDDQNLIFDVKKLHDKGGNMVKQSLNGRENLKINGSIKITQPKNDFEKKVITWYKNEIKNINL